MASSKQNFTLLNSDPNTGISICIPRVFNNISWQRIKRIFIDLHWGFVERVDVVPCGQFKRAFVHFAPGKWNMRDRQAQDVLAALKSGNEIKIVYDEPWFWKISLSRAKKPAEAPKPKPRPQVHIATEGAKELTTAALEPQTQLLKRLLKVPPGLRIKVPKVPRGSEEMSAWQERGGIDG